MNSGLLISSDGLNRGKTLTFMKAFKIIFGILLMLAALGNLRDVGGLRSSGELLGFMGATMLIFIVGAFLLYYGLKPKPPSLSITGEDDD